MEPITQDNDTINGIQNGDIFEVTIVISKNDSGVYSLTSQTIEVFRTDANNNNKLNLIFTIPNDNSLDATIGVSPSDLTYSENPQAKGQLPDSPTTFGGQSLNTGGGIHSSHVYQLPKTPKRKIRQISNKTLRKKQQRATRR